MPDVSNLTLSGVRPGQGQTNEVGNFQMSLLGHSTPPATPLCVQAKSRSIPYQCLQPVAPFASEQEHCAAERIELQDIADLGR